MEIKDQTITTDTDAEGNEIISEIDATYTETRSDGTEVSAEITTTADPDDPTQVEGHMTVTETAPDGTETVTEVTTSADGTTTVEEEQSFTEEIYEALFDTEIGDDDDLAEDNSDFVITDGDTDFDSVEFTDGDEITDSGDLLTDISETPIIDAPVDAAYQADEPLFAETPMAESPSDSVFETAGTGDSEINETNTAEIAEQEAHAEAAKDAQESADEFIASGDYNAAADARETAENESWEAGDDSMLSAYDAQDLTTAADKQENAAYYEAREAEHAQQGDYEAAKEDAGNAAYAVGDADYYAGGGDHTGQAKAEEYNMDNAVWHEGIADDAAENAAYYAEAGNVDAAESSADYAAEQQGVADHYGDLGEHGGDIAVYDPSSDVETGGTYDSSFDSHVADTSFDAGMDTGVSSGYDSGTDDV